MRGHIEIYNVVSHQIKENKIAEHSITTVTPPTTDTIDKIRYD